MKVTAPLPVDMVNLARSIGFDDINNILDKVDI